jgi:2-keto-4-pentenoate hydratase/2-oxohepta-3-ene-1,7-dioic acid hydratase in catechol pathway
MKLASFTASGRASYGVVVGDGVMDMGQRLKYPTLRAAIAANALGEIAAATKGGKLDLSLSQVTLLAPIPDAEKIVCAGKNYRGHVAEGSGKLPEHPSLFLRLNNSVVGHGGKLVRSKLSSDFDYEGELALVIGKGGRHIAQTDALSHIAGYSCFNEACFRDIQFKHSLTAGKNFFASGGFGPWMVTADEIPDPTALMLHTRLNGAEVQHTKTDDLIFDIPFLIAYISGFTELVPGDVIVTGTPEGVGFARKPPLWMKAGDTVEVDISGIGTLRNTVVDE